MPGTRYVALGDSQTEGLNDPDGRDGRGGWRGWADRFADHLAVSDPHLQYANLAVRGRLIGQIRTEQLAAALELRPDLATVIGGLNDVMRPSFDLDATLGHLAAMVGELRASGAVVLTNTFPDFAAIAPLFARLQPRVHAYNAGIRDVAGASGALLVDFARHGAGTDPRIWSPDRIHANAVGHALIAAAFADTAGLPGFGKWADPLPPALPLGRARRLAVEARWLGGFLAPWLVRRVRGRSSGDGRSAKRPQLVPVAPVFHLVEPQDWPGAGNYRPPSLDAEGFVHLSFADQVTGSADRHFAGARELVAVEVDLSSVDSPVRVEDSYGSGAAYPHVYGALPVSAAVAMHPLRRRADGGWAFERSAVSPGGAGVAASPDR